MGKYAETIGYLNGQAPTFSKLFDGFSLELLEECCLRMTYPWQSQV